MTWNDTKSGEKFLHGNHLRSQDWNGPSENYIYKADSTVFGGDYKQMSRFSIKDICHCTTARYAAAILTDKGLKPSMKKIFTPDGEKHLNLIWWGITVEHADVQSQSLGFKELTEAAVREKKYGGNEVPEVMKNFLSSPPFRNTSRYGNVRFTYSIEKVMEAYKGQYCQNEEPACRVLGTFAYKQEVNHVVLVCPTNVHEELALCSVDNSVMFKNDERRWIWKPDSTGYTYNQFLERSRVLLGNRKWEQATFAFFIPNPDGLLLLENLGMHISYCPEGKPFRCHVAFESRTNPETLDDIFQTLKKALGDAFVQPMLTILFTYILCKQKNGDVFIDSTFWKCVKFLFRRSFDQEFGFSDHERIQLMMHCMSICELIRRNLSVVRMIDDVLSNVTQPDGYKNKIKTEECGN